MCVNKKIILKDFSLISLLYVRFHDKKFYILKIQSSDETLCVCTHIYIIFFFSVQNLMKATNRPKDFS